MSFCGSGISSLAFSVLLSAIFPAVGFAFCLIGFLLTVHECARMFGKIPANCRMTIEETIEIVELLMSHVFVVLLRSKCRVHQQSGEEQQTECFQITHLNLTSIPT